MRVEGVMVWRSDFLAVSASEQQYDLAPSWPLSELSFLSVNYGSWVGRGELVKNTAPFPLWLF